MTDNELRFYAAKAAKIDFSIRGQVPTRFDGKDFIVWNPLANDGDALRLAVKLHLFDGRRLFELRLEETQADPKRTDDEITRRAIVRAAADIGKELP